MQIFSFSAFGYEGEIIKVEADLKTGLPVAEIVGLPGSAVKEARDRMRVAIKNSGFEFPLMRILINLSPASEKKDGSGFDLPIAVAVLNSKQVYSEKDENDANTEDENPKKSVLIIGELELSGTVRPVYGVLGAISAGIENGIKNFIVPFENKDEALIPGNVNVYGVKNLNEAMDSFAKIKSGLNFLQYNNISIANERKIIWSDEGNLKEDYSDVRGQESLLRSIEIAAAGGHNLLVYGPPGCGKTLSLIRFSSLLPDLDFKTAQQVTRIYSIAGLLPKGSQNSILMKRPPFRMPHQNASLEGIIGGAGKCMPGEISLAHGGVLFLDEANQFKAAVLQSLRAPLETGIVSLSRAERRTTFPARFQLLAAVNPCPCGNLGAENKFCTCPPVSVEKYWKKLTAPLLDRIDLRIYVEAPTAESLLGVKTKSTAEIRHTIKSVYEIQIDRNMYYILKTDNNTNNWKNSNLSSEEINKICLLTDEARRGFEAISEEKSLSGRGSHAILKIARTIADIEASEKITVAEIEEAIAMRSWVSFLPDFL
ncbi:MAG: magnesium chelatase [Treponema sp.]|nr:MAG: magnesium chelatase [Treponema sp.]